MVLYGDPQKTRHVSVVGHLAFWGTGAISLDCFADLQSPLLLCFPGSHWQNWSPKAASPQGPGTGRGRGELGGRGAAAVSLVILVGARWLGGRKCGEGRLGVFGAEPLGGNPVGAKTLSTTGSIRGCGQGCGDFVLGGAGGGGVVRVGGGAGEGDIGWWGRAAARWWAGGRAGGAPPPHGGHTSPPRGGQRGGGGRPGWGAGPPAGGAPPGRGGPRRPRRGRAFPPAGRRGGRAPPVWSGGVAPPPGPAARGGPAGRPGEFVVICVGRGSA